MTEEKILYWLFVAIGAAAPTWLLIICLSNIGRAVWLKFGYFLARRQARQEMKKGEMR